ncbi:hypothetical protein [Rodentibacter sp. Ppn85]|uniref:hypothetical protein n=1 Tax=Rodentibacter sp. Ppn85 TaxID=1908525 RepID=UPI001E32FE98|nr:hypothetical protein [Rodentibacter sp. Ppn85]
MLDNSLSIWVQDAFQITDKSQEKVLILVLGENENIAKSHIQYYQMNHRLRFSFSFNILPLDTYTQYHADEELREILYSETQKLSKNQPLFLFYPDRDLLPQTNTPNLKK